MKKNFLIFIPSIEDGGVEKNLFLLSNYLSNKIKNVEILTCNFNYKHFFKKEIKFIGTKSKFFFNKSRYIKYIICLLILIKRIIKDKNILIFAFQANIYAIIVAKIFKIKIITRSNSAPQGWSKNFIKQVFFGFFLKKADSIIVNSINFKKEMDKKYKINTIFIYNPFEKNSIKDPIQMYLQDIFTVHANLTGNPALSLPLGNHSNGLPFGIQIMSTTFDESALFQFAKILEDL